MEQKAIMAVNIEIEEQVDLDYVIYSEEDDDVEETMEYEGTGEGGEENDGEEPEDMVSRDSRKNQSTGIDGNSSGDESVEYEQKPGASNKKDENQIHAELLSLPPHGSEIYIGGLSRDILEEHLQELCEPFGEIFKIRVMKNRDTGESKGFAFVAFKTKDVAEKAINKLHGKEFKGRTLRCSQSDAKYRLFIGNVPKCWSDKDFKQVVEKTGPGAETIELIKDPQNPGHHRGFAFVEYYNNACADYSRQKVSADFKSNRNNLTARWAGPKIAPDHSAAAQVKALYVKNMPENTATGQLEELFQCHGKVTKVVMPPAKSGGKRDFAFVHYAERSSALKAIKDTGTYEINGQVLEVVLAKPQTEKKFYVANPHNSTSISKNISCPGYAGIPLNPYALMAAGYGTAAGFQQSMIYGRGPMPEGMQLVPVVLPDDRIDYVLQQPGAQMPQVRHQRSDRHHGAPGAGSSNDGSNSSSRYRPY